MKVSNYQVLRELLLQLVLDHLLHYEEGCLGELVVVHQLQLTTLGEVVLDQFGEGP